MNEDIFTFEKIAGISSIIISVLAYIKAGLVSKKVKETENNIRFKKNIDDNISFLRAMIETLNESIESMNEKDIRDNFSVIKTRLELIKKSTPQKHSDIASSCNKARRKVTKQYRGRYNESDKQYFWNLRTYSKNELYMTSRDIDSLADVLEATQKDMNFIP